METIIGLLMILLPVVFKLIGKRLEQAAKNQPPVTSEEETPVEDWAQTLKEYLEQQTVVNQAPSVVEDVVPEPMAKDSVEAHEPVQPKKQKQQRKPLKKSPILVEEEKKPKEKIDVKKLIVYSEIMKPKYTE
jgi:hypothetical protein